MNILICASTSLELVGMKEMMTLNNTQKQGHTLSYLVTGVGLMHTTFMLTNFLNEHPIDVVVQIGIGGTYHGMEEIGKVYAISKDRLGTCGVHEANKFNDLFDMGFMEDHDSVYQNGWIKNHWLDKSKYALPDMRVGITVDTITSNAETKALLTNKYRPDIETMEGAAAHYVCAQLNIKYLQLRGISNVVGDRDKTNWQIPDAIQHLHSATYRFIYSIGPLVE